MEFDLGSFVSAAFGAGAAWAGIKADLAAMRRDIDRLMSKVFD
ncbi:hypothetical protein ACJJI5_12395 [Microbulbifer sp. EKSA008]|nr:hypothetical protein QT397_14825 [Microbulbifer sp. MKSA007]